MSEVGDLESERAQRVLWLVLFAMSMGLVEAAVVVHLRHLYYPDDPLAIFPVRILSNADLVLELAREAATVLMLGSVAALAERGALRIFAAFLLVFGSWDLAYYVWLKVFLGWPVAWLEWDTLFLIPWAWFGPWVAPALIAVLFVAWGGAVLRSGRAGSLPGRGLALFAGGSALALVSFLQPGAGALLRGVAGFRGFVPGEFGWLMYAAGLAGMTAGLAWIGARTRAAGGERT